MHPARPAVTETTPPVLAAWLRDATVATVEDLARHHLPGWRIPRTFAGHEVAADVRADLCFTLTHLARAGVETVAGDPIDEVLTRLLGEVDGRSTHTFFSYRIAETLLRAGPFDGNPLLAGLDGAQREGLITAVDSSDWVELLDAGVLPRNYAGVLSRCALGQVRLGLADDEATLDRLVARLHDLLAENPHGALDDSHDRIGRYDIYSADVWLFVEPLGDRLGPVWTEGLRHALRMVRSVGTADGSAVPWGRSVGDLSAALTIELAAVALADGHDPDHAGLWLRRAWDATVTVLDGFADDGVSTAHVHRSQDSYRGPARRLQLTFDLLGKLADAAAHLGHLPEALADLHAAPAEEAYPAGDAWVPFEDDRPAGVWAVRRPAARLVIPFVGTSRSHYLPAPFEPGTFEVPVDRDLPCWTPLVVAGLRRHTAGGLPASIDHGDDGSLTATWDGLPVSGRGLDGDDPGPPLPATRTARYAVEGRTLVLEDHLTFEREPTAVSLAVPELGRRLHVEVDCPTPHAVSRISTAGLAEWRTPQGEVRAVHQVDLDPATDLRVTVRATPVLRVASTEPEHHYSRSLLRPLHDRVHERRTTPIGWRSDAAHLLRDTDVLHMHWPEWVGFDDIDLHRALIDELADGGVPIVWTVHNLTPHAKQPETYDPIYQLWAEAADAAIHHSHWGEAKVRERYSFGAGCRHEVIPHGHFGDLWARHLPSREEAERRMELPASPLRIGIVGAPREEKLVQVVLDGLAASERDDVQLVCWSLGEEDEVPRDRRIVRARRYEQVSPERYATRLAACDVLALVFAPDGEMLATGTAADATGLGIPALRSDWPYLVEALGDGGIPCGHSTESVAAAIDALTPEVLAAARAGAERRRDEISWEALAPTILTLYERTVQRLP